MGKPVARLGDTGSHGGSIITGASSILVNGKAIARVGDIYGCPIHGPNPIVTGSQSVFGQGQLVAHIGSKTACGAIIISGSPDTFVDDKVGEGGAFHSTFMEYYDEQIVAVDAATGKPIHYYPFFIETEDGRTYMGRTDEEGKTPRISTENKQLLTAYWGEEAVLNGAE